MTTQDEIDEADEAYERAAVIANELQAVLKGKNTISCIIALGRVIGAAAADAQHPDFDGLLRIVWGVAEEEFRKRKVN